MPSKKQTLTERVAVQEAKTEAHEKVCAERYTDIFSSFGRVHQRLDGIARMAWTILLAIAAWLVGVIGYLLINGAPWAPSA